MPERFTSSLFRSVRSRLIFLVAAVLLPAAVLVSWLIYQGYQNERHALERHLMAAAHATALLVDASMMERQALLAGLATSGRLAQGDLAGFRTQAAAVAERGNGWIVLIDAEGRQLVNTALPPDTPLPAVAFRAEFRAAAEAGRAYISNLVEGPATKRSVLFTAIPVLREHRLHYTLNFAISPAAFDSLLREGGAAEHWLVSLVDRSGVVAARNRRPEEYVGKRAGPAISAAMAAQREGVLESTTLDGVRSITAFTRAEKSGWEIVVAAPEAELYASAERLWLAGFAVALLLGLAATSVALWIGRGLFEAVRALVKSTEALAGGRAPDAATTTGIVEMDAVHRALVGTASQLAEREAELTRLNASLTLARDEALAASRTKDEFLAALSHELRTPLNPVLLVASDAAQNPEFPPPAREAFALVAKNAALEARLIDDLLDLTRITQGKLSFQRQRVEVGAVLCEAIANVRADADEKAQTIAMSAGADGAVVEGDPIRLQQVFWNVLKNAVKFTPPGGRIRVATAIDGGRLKIGVEDSGIGMTAEEIARCFEVFAQGEHAEAGSRHRFGGLGLGLAITRMLVELHGGRIGASSAGRGAGTCFTIELPLAPRQEARGAATAGEGVSAKADAPSRRRRLLLVEDHHETRRAVERLLTRRGYEVVGAENAAAALLAVENGPPVDFVISDIGLPDLDGYALMEQLRARHGLRGFALTGYGMAEDIERGRAAGFVEHLTKPVDVHQLAAALARVLPETP